MKINFKTNEENEKKRYETGKYIFKKPNKLSKKAIKKFSPKIPIRINMEL